jgi:DNA modification methylase
MTSYQSVPLPDVRQSPTDSLRPHKQNAKTHSARQIRQIGESIRAFGFLNPILIDESNSILAGHGRWAAAKKQGLASVPTVRYEHLTETQKRAYVLADNKIAEQSGWDRDLLRLELGELVELLPNEGLEIDITGFAIPELDALEKDLGSAASYPDDVPPAMPVRPVTRRGDVWRLGPHRLICGDAQDALTFERLMQQKVAAAVFCDPPYNVSARSIGGRGRIQHEDFAFAAGEMSQAQFQEFLRKTLGNAAAASAPGAVHYACMDWRHIADLIDIGRQLYEEMLNLVVWNKTNGGQGSFYRSQHELIGVFRVAGNKHRNNVELGRFGRNRSNVWTYAGVNTFGRDRLKDLASHPTVKPIAMVADAILDCTGKGDIILDPFLGSGTTLLAAEKVGRIGFGIEFEPGYVDVTIKRWEEMAKLEAALEENGVSFEEVRNQRTSDDKARADEAADLRTNAQDEARDA